VCSFRHLLLDLTQLLPHSKKDAKLDTKSDRAQINEVADMKGCTSVLFFEARKHKDLYVWLAKTPHGPSVKFHVTNSECSSNVSLKSMPIIHSSFKCLSFLGAPSVVSYKNGSANEVNAALLCFVCMQFIPWPSSS